MLMLFFASVANSSLADTNNHFYVKAMTGISWEIHDTVASQSASFVSNSMNSVIFAGGIGYQFMPFLRGELEYAYRPDYQLSAHSNVGDITDSNVGFTDIRAQTVMANIYLDYPLNRWTPYITGGLGYGIINYGTTSIYNVALANIPVGIIPSNINNKFVNQIGAGLLFSLTKDLRLEANYHFVNMGKLESGNGLNVVGGTLAWPNSFNILNVNKIKLRSNELLLGIHYDFE